jgi:hypothetical protein
MFEVSRATTGSAARGVPKAPGRKQHGMNWLEEACAEIERLTPTEGFNVVAVDGFERAGTCLYLVGHYDDRAEAERAAQAHRERSGDRTHVYAPPRDAATRDGLRPRNRGRRRPAPEA